MDKLIDISGESVPRGRAFLITRDGITIGYIRRFTKTRTDTFPWQAFGRLTNPIVPRPLLGSFHTETGGKAMAIAAVLAAADKA